MNNNFVSTHCKLLYNTNFFTRLHEPTKIIVVESDVYLKAEERLFHGLFNALKEYNQGVLTAQAI